MATFRVRNLFCIFCCEAFRVRNRLVGDTEVLSRCPECDRPLFDCVGFDPQPSTPGPSAALEAFREAYRNGDRWDDDLP